MIETDSTISADVGRKPDQLAGSSTSNAVASVRIGLNSIFPCHGQPCSLSVNVC